MNIKKIKSQLSEELRRERRIKLRMAITSAMIGAGFLVVIFRAVDLHCFKNDALNFIASKQYQAVIPQSARRGRILDRNGRVLAESLPVRSAYADPRLIPSKKEAAAAISKMFDLNEKELLDKFNSNRKFVWIERRAEQKSVVDDAVSIQGVFTLEEARRIYPNGELASQLLGAVGFESEALGGIELSYDKFLSSKHKDATYKRDAKGRFYLSPASYQEQDDVADIYLTIDKQVQFAAENALKKAVEAAHAAGGTAIVMDVATGEILAMANMPSFDPNDYSKYDQASWRNRGVTDSVEPGSTFKVLIVSAALDAGAVTPETTFDCERGAISVGNAVLHDHSPYGVLPVKDIIKVSSNIGALKIARQIGREKLFDYLAKFGFGKKTGIDFPGEVSGIVRWHPEKLQQVEFDTVAFGQGISVTPIQMISAFAGIANGGRLMRPYLIDRIVNNQGIAVLKSTPEVVAEPINTSTAQTVVHMLERVVEAGGTGKMAASSEYRMAGKTGTAQKVAYGAGHYASGKYYASFIGFAPSEAPRIAVFVGIDEPAGAYYGGAVAGPVFRSIAENSLKALSVPSSMSKVVFASHDPLITVQNNPNMRFQKIGDGVFQVASVKGATIREVLNAIGRADIKLKIIGSGVAESQYPAEGGIIREGEEFRVSFRQ